MSDNDFGDEKKWLQWASVNPKQFFLFYKKYYRPIYNFVYMKTLDCELSDDLTSDTFLSAQANLSQFKWKGVPFGAWLYRIARNNINEEIRARKRHWNFAENSRWRDIPKVEDALSQLILTEKQQQARQALQGLDEETQNMVILRYWGGRKVREIAVILRMNENTVKSRLSRGMKKMREVLERSETVEPSHQ